MRSLLVALIIMFGLHVANAQFISASEYKIKAVFLYNFTHFVELPPQSFDDLYSPLIIGIIGGDPFGPFIDEAVADERVKTHIIKVKRYADISEMEKCNILYINEQDPEAIRHILSTVADKSILTVSDTPNFIRWGGLIRFYTENNNIRLEINNTAARRKEITISSKLLRVATVQ